MRDPAWVGLAVLPADRGVVVEDATRILVDAIEDHDVTSTDKRCVGGDGDVSPRGEGCLEASQLRIVFGDRGREFKRVVGHDFQGELVEDSRFAGKGFG